MVLPQVSLNHRNVAITALVRPHVNEKLSAPARQMGSFVAAYVHETANFSG